MPDQPDLPEGVKRWEGGGGFSYESVSGKFIRIADLPAIRAAAVEKERERLAGGLMSDDAITALVTAAEGPHPSLYHEHKAVRDCVARLIAALDSDSEGEN